MEGYRCAVVFHHGARGGELLARVSCSYVEFFPCRALPGGRGSAAKILSSDAAVFTSARAVRHFAEVGGPQAVRELAKKEKEYVPSPKRSLFPPLLQSIYCRQVISVDDLSSVLHEVLKQVATQIVEKAKMGKKLTVRDLFLYLLSEDYKDKERRIKRGYTPAGGRWAGAP